MQEFPLVKPNKPNFGIDSSANHSMHPYCQQQTVLLKLSLKIEHPRLYERLVLDYKN